ncbi:T9SS type A sorting domain-containing protein [Flavobacterium sp.]|uniref:T9SS type A sorting domain-containing protein n=1 Tax=Flavobacterium sp. TaxID=239 RepID=UPI0026243D40|nr:T9SS type A sorting domain-containing protein [Flavobacterium sp.]MDD2986038.1 T9SS type A sorting domain-containing protein [Flavobacterium sp.]
MKNNILLLFFFIYGTNAALAQSNSVVSGNTATGTSGLATYTVGQIVYKSFSGTNASATQGLQQPFEINALNVDEVPQIQLVASVYPNPTSGNLSLTIKEYDISNIHYQLYDSIGKIILNGQINQNETQIEMVNLPAALYFLKITKNQDNLKTFKIIKN